MFKINILESSPYKYNTQHFNTILIYEFHERVKKGFIMPKVAPKSVNVPNCIQSILCNSQTHHICLYYNHCQETYIAPCSFLLQILTSNKK
jgi:hypothetical protein